MNSISEEHFRKLERMYLRAPTNDYFRPKVEIGEGLAKINIAVRPEFFHAGGAVHGNVYFKALDDAAFFAVNSLVNDVFVLTALYEIRLVLPIAAGIMYAAGKVISASRKVFTAEAEVRNSEGQLIGTGHGKFLRSTKLLTPEIGYF